MKKILSLVLIAVVAVSCTGNKTQSLPGVAKSAVDSASYAIGVSFSQMLKQADLHVVNMNELMKGFNEAFNNKPNRKISDEQIGQLIQEYMIKSAAANGILKKQEEDKFLAGNAKKDSVQATESGLQYKIVNMGDENCKPVLGDTVLVHYTGALTDGSVFDSSYGRDPEPVKIHLTANGVIKGWSEGLQLIGKGGSIKLWIPFALGYGERSMGPSLPAYSTLVFDVELFDVLKGEPEEEAK